MAAKGSDILMKVMVENGKLLQADAQTEIHFDEKQDTLAAGFNTGSVFEVNDFSFNLGKSGSTASGADTAGLSSEEIALMLEQNRQRQEAEENPSLVVEVEPVSFTRWMDSASPALLQCMVDRKTLSSISIIKRKAAGTAQAGRTYFRVDFIKVLLIGLDWDDEDNLVTEKCTFICRRVDMKFRSQKADGTFGPTVPGSWIIAS